jgi:hypothetical protein
VSNGDGNSIGSRADIDSGNGMLLLLLLLGQADFFCDSILKVC